MDLKELFEIEINTYKNEMGSNPDITHIKEVMTEKIPKLLEEKAYVNLNNGYYPVIGHYYSNSWQPVPRIWIMLSKVCKSVKGDNAYFLTYLFEANMKKVYLGLSLGWHQFKRRNNNKFDVALKEIESTAQRIRNKFKLQDYESSDLELSDNSLSVKCYEKGTICHLCYSTDNLPKESALLSDLVKFKGLYELLANSNLDIFNRELINKDTSSKKCSFKLDGNIRIVKIDQDEFRYKNMKGFDYIDILLRYIDTDVNVLKLHNLVNTNKSTFEQIVTIEEKEAYLNSLKLDNVYEDNNDQFDVLDAQAVSEYRERLIDIKEEKEVATNIGDFDELNALEDEEKLLLRQFNIKFISRRFTNDDQNKRNSVAKCIRSAIKKMIDLSPNIGTYFKNHIDTGWSCSYNADDQYLWDMNN